MSIQYLFPGFKTKNYYYRGNVQENKLTFAKRHAIIIIINNQLSVIIPKISSKTNSLPMHEGFTGNYLILSHLH